MGLGGRQQKQEESKASMNQGGTGPALPQRKVGASRKTLFLGPEKQEGWEAELSITARISQADNC